MKVMPVNLWVLGELSEELYCREYHRTRGCSKEGLIA